MKIHQPIIQGLHQALVDTFKNNFYADKVVAKNLKENRKWGSRDRRFFAEVLYDIVRNFRRLKVSVNSKLDKVENSELESSDFYKILFLWLVLKYDLKDHNLIQGHTSIEELSEFAENWKELKSDLQIKESMAPWMFYLLKDESEDYAEIVEALNSKTKTFLRTNTLKTTRDALIEDLKSEEVEVEKIPDSEIGLYLTKRKNVL